MRLSTVDAQRSVLADAQIDDYHGRDRASLSWAPPVRFEARVRWSHQSAQLRGTTGFGFWNDPIDLMGRFAAAPNALWFFHASEPSRLRLRRGKQGQGLVAAGIAGGQVSQAVLGMGNLALRIPGVNRLATRLGARQVGGGDVLLPPDLDLSAWHDYALDWQQDGAIFSVDGKTVARLAAEEVPRIPLGFVAWIDNNWTALTEDGRYRAGRLDAPGSQWLDIAHIMIDARAS